MKRHARAACLAAVSQTRGGYLMRVGAFYFPTDYGINVAELARALEERGFDSLYRLRAHAHPDEPQEPLPRRRRAAQAVRAYARSLRRAFLCRGGDEDTQARHRHLPDPAARPDHDGEIGRQPRPALGRALHLRHRRRLERRGDGEPRRQLRDALQADARARAGDEGAVDQGGGRVSRRVRQLRPVWPYPKPKQRPHPPILLGGETDYTLKRIVEFCDGWFPRPRGGMGAQERRRAPAPHGQGCRA